MKRPTSIFRAAALGIILLASQLVLAQELEARQIDALKNAGVPLYPDSSYTNWHDGDAMVLWFSSSDSPEKIMDWYKDKLSGWSEKDWKGARVIYKGPEDMAIEDISTKIYLWARITDENDALPDSEITIYIPQ